MNILYIGPYLHKSDGWGDASLRYIKALSLKNNLKIVPFNMINNLIKKDDFIKGLERNKFEKYDAVIQNVLPGFFTYDGRLQNIGLCFLETSNLEYGTWGSRFALMDKMIVCSEKERIEVIKYNKNVYKVGIPCDPSIVGGEYPTSDAFKRTKNTFVYYFIGSNTSRKNYRFLIDAYLSEFSFKDDVSLVLKINNVDVPAMQNEIRDRMKVLRKFSISNYYSPIYIIGGDMDIDQIYGLHQSCDCIVAPSHGESFNIPCFDAMLFNNNIIASDQTGMSEFLTNDNSYKISGKESPAICEDPPLPDIYTSNETWFNPDINSLKQNLRLVYKDKELREHKKTFYNDIINKYTYSSIGDKLTKCLEEHIQ